MSADRASRRANSLRFVALSLLVLLCIGTRWHRVQMEANFAPEAAMEYGTIARNLVAGNGYTMRLKWGGTEMPTVHMPPGITFILAGFYWLDIENPLFVFQLLQVAASAISLVAVWLLARRAFSEAAAWMAAVLFTVDLNLMLAVAQVNETILNIMCVALGLLTIDALDRRPRASMAICCGLLFAIGALIRPVVLLILTLSLLWLLYRHRSHLMVMVKQCAVVSVVVLAMLTPWSIRNYRVTGKFVPICSNWAINFWLGYNPRAGGSQYDLDGNVLHPTGPLAEQLRQAESELEMDRLLSDAGWKYVAEQPWDALTLRPYCFLYFWIDHNYWLDPMPYPTSLRYRAANFALVGLTALAMLLNWRRTGLARLFLIIMVSISLFYTLFHADIGHRFRLQIEPLMLMFVGQLLTMWIPRSDAPKKEPTAVPQAEQPRPAAHVQRDASDPGRLTDSADDSNAS